MTSISEPLKVQKVKRKLTDQEKAAALVLFNDGTGISKEEFQRQLENATIERYPTAEENPNCCYHQNNPMAPMFCIEGHLTECHQGMDCEEARCEHYKTQIEESDE